MLAKKRPVPEDTFSKKTIALLALLAVAVIVAGLVARDALIDPDAAPSAPPSEASALQRFTQESQLRDAAEYIRGRVDLVAPMVVRVPAYNASGLRWGSRDTVVTTSALQAIVVLEVSSPDTMRARLRSPADSVRRDWLLVVGRDAGERVISWYGIHGGRAYDRCGAAVIEKLVLGPSLSPEFVGAGIFDLDGRVRGIVVDCGGHLAPIPMSEITRLLADTTSSIVTP